ncbi:hypothetical protein D3C78_1533410 [compost metagenome]
MFRLILPLLHGLIVGNDGLRHQQIFQIQLIKLEIKDPFRLATQHDAGAPFQRTVVRLQVKIIQLKLLLFFAPDTLQTPLPGYALSR